MKWPPQKIERLLALAADGLYRREIAAHMGANIHSVSTKLCNLGVIVALEAPCEKPERSPKTYASATDLWHLRKCPRFEDITSCEARRIAAGAPPSGRPRRHHDVSLTGNAAALCVVAGGAVR